MKDLMEKIVSLSKRRGFVFQSSEIYGGFGSCYDFGPLGTEMKNNIKKAWWDEMTKKQNLEGEIVGLDSSILMSPKVWEASGHLSAGFADELVECFVCKKRFKTGELEKNICPDCKKELSDPKKFNLMMKTFIGPVEEKAAVTYLRAETCQGIYLNFNNVLMSMRLKIPFGIAQIGKSFRNEITPKDFIFRMREFEQMEMQWFCHPQKADEFFEYFLEQRVNWYLSLGIKKQNLRSIEVPEKDRAHYALRQVDIEYKFPFGWKEIEGVHNRGDWDLSNHSKHSKKDLKYYDLEKQGYFPYVIETSVGVERSLFAFLCDAYSEIEKGRTQTTTSTKEQETVLSLDKKIAPIKVLVLPLVKNNSDIVEKAKEVYKAVKPYFTAQYDEAGSVGRRYRRGDEVGVLFAITIDFETLEKGSVTIRERDTMNQERVMISDLVSVLNQKLDTC